MEEDFYLSKKQLARSLMMPMGLGGMMTERGVVSIANINGQWKRYTECVPKGKKPLSNYDDLILIGSGKDVEIKHEQLSGEEITNLLIEMKRK